MQLIVKREEIEHEKTPYGIEISVEGFKGDNSSVPTTQVFIEVYEGKLRVHTWNGMSQDPTTVVIDPLGDFHHHTERVRRTERDCGAERDCRTAPQGQN